MPPIKESDLVFNNIKEKGSSHYKGGEIEPIDLYKSGKMLRDFALCSIIKYAYRNRFVVTKEINKNDLKKIIHYCEILMEEV